MADALPPGWTDAWLESLPYGIPASTIHAASMQIVREYVRMPSFHEFRNLCDRVMEDLCLH